jgi:glycosyltransferase involved in cell wall biosynthesis
MTATPPRILFVDFAPQPGGSIHSLVLLLRHLPRQTLTPYVLLAPTVARLPVWSGLDLPIVAYDAGQGRPAAAQPAGTLTRRLRHGRLAALSRGHPLLGPVWQMGSIVRRLWTRTRPTAAFIARLIEREGIDLLHLNDALPLAEPGLIAARWKRRPAVVVARSFAVLDPCHRLLSRLATAGVFTSAVLQADHRRQGARFPRERIIPNAVDLTAYEQVPDREGVRRELGLPPSAHLAVVVGRLMRRKGLHTFIRALAGVAPAWPSLYGLLVGDTDPLENELPAELQALAQSLGVADRVRFTGYRADVPRLLAAADFLCFVPSEPEPFGRTVIEGMAAGLPVIVAANGALPELVGGAGLVVPPDDAEALATALAGLLADPARAQALGAAGRRRARAEFGIARQVAALTALYAECLRA